MSVHFSVLIYLGCFLFSFCVTFLYKKWALNKSILDIPNTRSSHQMPTPRGGGIAIIITFYLCLSVLVILNRIERNLYFALLPGIALALVGLIDDIYGLSPVLRFSVQLLCAAISLYILGGFHGYFKSNLIWFWSLIALLGSIWYINLFNFLDGSDGYASMEAISVLFALWIFTGLNTLLILVFSIGGFFYWNWPKAKIFMGDVGSTTLGFILVVLGFYLHNNNSLDFHYWIIITALFWFDATITLLYRLYYREKLSEAHKNHVYQRSIRGGFSHLQTMLAGFLINVLLFIIAYAIWKSYCSFLTGIIIVTLILWAVMKYIDQKCAFTRNY